MFPTALKRLELGREYFPSLRVDYDVFLRRAGWCYSLLLSSRHCVRRANCDCPVCMAGNNIGDEGVRAIGEAITPREQPDGTWAFNAALHHLNLESECSPPRPDCRSLPLPVTCPCTLHGTTNGSAALSLYVDQTTALEKRAPRPWPLPWSLVGILTTPGCPKGRGSCSFAVSALQESQSPAPQRTAFLP